MTIPTLSTLPTAPARTDAPATFVTRADAFLAALVTFQSEMNTSIGAMNTDIAGVNQDAQDAADSAASAVASANFKGAWSSLTGALNIPASVSHSGSIWILLNNLADVTASEPGVSADWQDLPIIPSQTGQGGKYLTTDGSSTSWGAIAAAGEIERTAAANITAGDPVAILSNGQVTPITGTQTVGFNTPIVGVSAGGGGYVIRLAYDEANSAVVAIWFDPVSSNLSSRVGLISGSTISWGSATTINTPANTYHDIAYDPDTDRWLIVYRDYSSGQGYARVGQRISDSITWGTASAHDTNSCTEHGLVYDTVNNKFVVSYSRSGTLYTNVITVSGLTFTAGTPTNTSYSMTEISSIYDATNSRIITVGKNGSSNVALIGFTSDGSTLSRIGTQAEMTAGGATTTMPSVAYDPNADVYVVGHMTQNSPYVKLFANAVDLTGSTYTVGADFKPAGDNFDQLYTYSGKPNSYVQYIPALGHTIFRTCTHDGSVATGKWIGLEVSGTTLSQNSFLMNYDARYFGRTSKNMEHQGAISVPNKNGILLFNSTNTGSSPREIYSNLIGFGSTDTNANAYFGIAADTFTATNTGTINILGGSNLSVTGLSAGSDYWVDYDGSLSSTDTGYGKVGTATSATSILLTGGAEDATTPSVSGRISTQVGSTVSAGDALFVNAQGLPARIEVRPVLDFTHEDFWNGYQDPTPSGVTSDYVYNNLPTPDGGGILVTKDNSSNYMRAIPWTIDDSGNVTFGTQVSVLNGYAMGSNPTHFNCEWNEAGGFWNVVVMDTSFNCFIQSWSKSGTTMTVEHSLSGGAAGGGNYGTYMDWNPDENHLGVVFEHQSNSDSFIFRAYQFSGYTISQVGSQYWPVHNMPYDCGFSYNPVANVFQVVGSSSTFGTFRYYSIEFGGTNYTGVSSGTLTGIPYKTSYSYNADLEYDVSSGYMLYMRYDASNTVKIWAIEITGNTLAQTGTEYSNTAAYYYTYSRNRFVVNNPVCVFDYGGFYLAGAVFDGSTVTAPYSTTIPNNSSPHGNAFLPTNGVLHLCNRASNTQFLLYKWEYQTANSDAFFGFASESAQQGLNGQIDLIGGINTNQTGLTSGAVYYAQADGSIGTTVTDNKVGKAITPTKMYVTG